MKEYPNLRRVRSVPRVDEILTEEFGSIGWGSNGGFQAVNLAVQFGASRILLLGLDYSIEKGVHFHGRHQPPLSNPRQASVDKWRGILDRQAPIFEKLGIEVINCAPHSRLAAYPRMPILDALKLPAPAMEET
ncbi:MAG: hypothetical protein CMB99_16465 [Flavobacteriaceae bacterium]|nr:hypothetical protein [Flavobacteriaceae bacterium]